jgi:hypothetical protein
MNTFDFINGSFEAVAALFTLHHCRVLLRDRAVAGVSIASMAFFTLWGVWNLWFYPHLGQTWSFAGGVLLVAANAVYVALLFRFSGFASRLRHRWQSAVWKARKGLGRVVCTFKGCHYDTPVFCTNALYLCTRCGKEVTGRTFADLQPMSSDELDDIHRLHEIYEEDHIHA